MLLYEFKADMASYLATRGPGPNSMKDLIAFNESHRALEMPYFEQEIFLMADQKGPLTDEAYLKALQKNHQLSRAEGIDATLKKYHLDAIIAPTGGPMCLIDPVIGDKLIPPPWIAKAESLPPGSSRISPYHGAGRVHLRHSRGHFLKGRATRPCLLRFREMHYESN